MNMRRQENENSKGEWKETVLWVFHTANEGNFFRIGHDWQTHSSCRDCHTDRSLHAGCRVYAKRAANSRAENRRQSGSEAEGAQPQMGPITNEGESI